LHFGTYIFNKALGDCLVFKDESGLFAVGHMALAYLLSKSSAKLLKVNFNIPLVLVLSIIPDADILLGVSSLHRGPTHSLIVALLIFAPLFVVYRRKAVPYFLALISHAAIADFIVGGQIMLFWPLTSQLFGLHGYIDINSLTNIALEWTLFVVSTIVLFKTRDSAVFFQNRKSNLLLAIPISTVLLPTLVSYPLHVPLLMMPPHAFYLVLFSIAVLTVIAGTLKKPTQPTHAESATSLTPKSYLEPNSGSMHKPVGGLPAAFPAELNKNS
jgi:hypothetical protein